MGETKRSGAATMAPATQLQQLRTSTSTSTSTSRSRSRIRSKRHLVSSSSTSSSIRRTRTPTTAATRTRSTKHNPRGVVTTSRWTAAERVRREAARVKAHENSSSLSSSSSFSSSTAYDAIGLGQAMVDYAGYVSDDFLTQVLTELTQTGAKIGDRIQVSVDELGSVLNKLDSADFKVTTGGSLSNSLVALSRLGGQQREHLSSGATGATGAGGGGVLRVGMAGLVGADPVGSFYKAKMNRAGVSFLSEDSHATTGTVIVLTTPDAQRTMLSHFPAPTGKEAECILTRQVKESIKSSRVLLVEGYLWECGPRVVGCLLEAMRVAQENGTLVCVTLSDTSVVDKHNEALWYAIRNRNLVDMVFANAAEAQALTCERTPKEAALALAQHTRMVSVVTDGHHGSHLAGMGTTQLIPPYWMPKGPLDTCGAGDAYAAGVLYGLLRGASIRGMGYTGARVSSTVISQRGARLKTEDALKLVEVLPMMMYDQTKLIVPKKQQGMGVDV